MARSPSRCLADAARVMPLPDGMDFEHGAAFMFTYGTSLHALRQCAKLQAGETLLVLGAAGGVGLAAIEIAKVIGARVIAAASSADKLALCRKVGADETINYNDEDLRKRVDALTDGRGADVVYDAGRWPLQRACAARNGLARALPRRRLRRRRDSKAPAQPGAAEGALDRRRVLGRRGAPRSAAARRQHAPLADWFAAGRVRPVISERVPLSGATAAIARLANRQAMGKLVVLP